MAEEKGDWTNDSEEVDMDWATEAETAEAQAEMERREAQTKEEGALAETKTEAKKPAPPKGTPRGGRGGGRGGRGGSRGGRGGARGDRPKEGGRSGGNRAPSNAVLLTQFPPTYKEADVRKFLTSVAKEPVEESKIDKVTVFFARSDRFRAIVWLKDTESFEKAMKANKTVVEGKEVKIEQYHDRLHTSDGARGARRSGPSAGHGSSSKPAGTKASPFGEARANDTQMLKEREQIAAEEEKKKTPAEGEAAAAAPAEGDAAAAAPAAEGEVKPEEKASEEVKPEEKTEQKTESAAPAAKPAPAKNAKKGGKAAAMTAAEAKAKAQEEKKKALLKQQKEKEKKRKQDDAEKRKKDKTFDPFSILSPDE